MACARGASLASSGMLRASPARDGAGRSARSPARGRRAGTAGRPSCISVSAGVRGATVNTTACGACAASIASDAGDVPAVVVNEAVHRDDIVELAERGIEHVADAPINDPSPRSAWRALAREIDEGRRNVDGDHVGAALRRARPRARRCRNPHRECARRADRRATRRAAYGASRRGRRARWRGCGRPARWRSAASRLRPRCGRNRCAAPRDGRGRWRLDINQTPGIRRGRGPSSAWPRSAGKPRHSRSASDMIFVLHRLDLGRGLHLEQRAFLQPAAAHRVEIAEYGRRASGRFRGNSGRPRRSRRCG